MFNNHQNKLLYCNPEIELIDYFPDLLCTSGDIEGYNTDDDYVWT